MVRSSMQCAGATPSFLQLVQTGFCRKAVKKANQLVSSCTAIIGKQLSVSCAFGPKCRDVPAFLQITKHHSASAHQHGSMQNQNEAQTPDHVLLTDFVLWSNMSSPCPARSSRALHASQESIAGLSAFHTARSATIGRVSEISLLVVGQSRSPSPDDVWFQLGSCNLLRYTKASARVR